MAVAGAATLLLLALTGCAESSRPDDSDQPAGHATRRPRAQGAASPAGREKLRRFRTDASALAKTYGERLRGELTAAIGRGGAAVAIDVCSSRAPEIAREVSTDSLTIRRIGTRVRNQMSNTPTPAQGAVLERLSAASPEFVGVLDGRSTYLRAILIQDAMCLRCHGPRESIEPDVLARLANLYPGDEATGYRAGDLRGAFVVEERAGGAAEAGDPRTGGDR